MSLGTFNPQSMPSISDDAYNVEQDSDKLLSDEINFMKQPSNLFRVLGSMAGVMAVSAYNGQTDIRQLGIVGGLMGLSSVASIQLSQVLTYKGYASENKEEHIIIPMSMAMFYLISNRSISRNDSVALQALAGGAGSLAMDSFWNTQKPQN